MGEFVHVYNDGGGIRDVPVEGGAYGLQGTGSVGARDELRSELDQMGLQQVRNPLVITPASSTVYVFKHPTTLSTSYQNGEWQIWVPLEAGWYHGTYLGKKTAANMVASVSDLAIGKPGLHKWHNNAAAVKTGSWTTSPATTATGAFTAAGVSYSLTAGDTISCPVTVLDKGAIAVRTYATTNGGFGIVAIDGDYTRANRLPAFTDADYAGGFCRATDVGKRYINCFLLNAWSDCAILADDLPAGTYTITVQATGTKTTAASAARCYVEGFASVNGGAIPTADVHMIPIHYISHDTTVSAQIYVPKWAPAGSTNYQFMGENHSDNATQSKETDVTFTVYVNEVDQSALAAGSYASGQHVTIYHETTIAHVAALGTPVANKKRTYTFQAGGQHPAMCQVVMTWLAAGRLNVEYAGMLTIGNFRVAPAVGISTERDEFTTYEMGGIQYPLLALNNDATYYKYGKDRIVWAIGSKLEAWMQLINAVPNPDLYSKPVGIYQDRTGGTDKMYNITSNSTQIVPINEVRTFTLGWGGKVF